jgi:hypothetical protein
MLQIVPLLTLFRLHLLVLLIFFYFLIFLFHNFNRNNIFLALLSIITIYLMCTGTKCFPFIPKAYVLCRLSCTTFQSYYHGQPNNRWYIYKYYIISNIIKIYLAYKKQNGTIFIHNNFDVVICSQFSGKTSLISFWIPCSHNYHYLLLIHKLYHLWCTSSEIY